MTLMTNVPFKPLDSWTVKSSELQLQTPPSNHHQHQVPVSSFLPSSAQLGVVSSAAVVGRGQYTAVVWCGTVKKSVYQCPAAGSSPVVT